MKVDLDGEFSVLATPAETFAFITTPEKFAPILPYFKELRPKNQTQFNVVLEVGVPQIRGQADVFVTRSSEAQNERVVYDLSGRHALGVIDARLTFVIAQIPQGSQVTWTSAATVSGTLASLAQGILVPLTKRQIKSLVVSVQRALGAVEDPVESTGALGRGLISVRSLFGNKAAADRKQGSGK